MHEPSIEWVAGESARRRLGDSGFLADWRRLFEACPWATAFQHPRFLQAWYAVHARRCEPVLVLGQSTSGLSGVLALARTPEGKDLRVAGGQEALYQGWLTPPGAGWRFLTLALERVRAEAGVTSLGFERLPPQLPAAKLEPGAGARAVVQEHPRPSILLSETGAGHWSERVRARAMGALDALGGGAELRLERAADPAEMKPLLDLVFGDAGDAPLSAAGAAPAGKPSRALIEAELRHGGPLHVTGLWAGERLVSAHVGHEDRGVLHLGTIGVAPELDAASGGALHLLELARVGAGWGLETLDLLALEPAEREGLANREDTCFSLSVFRSRGGRLRRPTAITTARHLAAAGLRRAGLESRTLLQRLPEASSVSAHQATTLIKRLMDLDGQRLSTRRGLYERAKSMGLFDLARRVTGRSLRILGYHAFSRLDQHELDPYLFMRFDVFERRLELLRQLEIPVLGLADAVERMQAGRLPDCATVLTFDDGFISTFEAMETVRRQQMEGTVYVATRYLDQPTPVVDVTLRYLTWRSAEESMPLDGLGLSLTGTLNTRDQDDVVRFAVRAARELEDLEQANEVLRRVAERLGQDYDALLESRALSFATVDELRQTAAIGTDLQLHTHSHELPTDPARVREEIARNRQELADMVPGDRHHFAYPSGIWTPMHFPALRELGIRTAVTCDAGLNHESTEPLELKRFIDSDAISEIVFEAEITGFAELLRGVRRGLRAMTGSAPG